MLLTLSDESVCQQHATITCLLPDMSALPAGSSFSGNDQDGSPLGANAQPALMTVGYDGMIRIWVEVTLSPSLGAPGSPSR